MSEQKEIKKNNDIEDRTEKFNKELSPILGKYKLGISAEPQIKEGLITARPVIVDMSEQDNKKENTES